MLCCFNQALFDIIGAKLVDTLNQIYLKRSDPIKSKNV